MSNIFSYYTKYTSNIDEYNNWQKTQQSKKNSADPGSVNKESLKKKAKTIAEPLLLLDSYEHEKAEDAETFFQTLNIELMSAAGLLCSIPAAFAKLPRLLSKHSENHNLIKKAEEGLSKYANATIKVAGKQVPISKALTAVSAIGSAVFFAEGIKKSMKSQLGLIRKASFDATQNIINSPELFVITTPEQEDEINSIIKYDEKNKTDIVDKLKDKVNFTTSFQSVEEFNRDKKDYEEKKKAYFENNEASRPTRLYSNQTADAKEDKMLFENYLKNVEHDVLEPLRKVETIANISYSALFTGGFLEYLITDKLVDVLKVKNTPLKCAIKFGVPLLTYFVLNKNISNIENKAILATKYKHLNQFIENPEEYSTPKEDKKQNPLEFVKMIYKDMKDYNEFAKNELPRIKEKTEAKKLIEYTPEQLKEAKLLQKNTAMTINTQRENVYEQSIGIKSLSETLLGPLDIAATAIGGFLGHKMSKLCGNPKLSKAFTGLGAIIAFVPAAIIEAKLTKQQKLAEKIAAMTAIKDLQDPKLFADNNNMTFSHVEIQDSPIFENFAR